jgi:acyl carrier protein
MGAGIEDAIAVKALQYQRVPPIPNLLEARSRSRRPHAQPVVASSPFATRSVSRPASDRKLALTVWEKIAVDDKRIEDQPAYDRWLQRSSPPPGSRSWRSSIARCGLHHGPPRSRARCSPRPRRNAARAVAESAPRARVPGAPTRDQVVASLVELIAAKTGYEKAEIDPEYELEADLGIDTVKQAEIFGEVRDRYGLAPRRRLQAHRLPDDHEAGGWLTARSRGAASARVDRTTRPRPSTPPPPRPRAERRRRDRTMRRRRRSPPR